MTASFTAGTIDSQELQDDLNELLIALRDQGIKIGASSDGTDISYEMELTGSAADKFTVVADTNNANQFKIQNKGGATLATIEVDEGNITAATPDSASAMIVATDITAAQADEAIAKYYDKDGNEISANALNKYFSTDSQGNVSRIEGAPALYDAVGNVVTTPNPANIASLQDLTAALSLTLHVGADATSNNQITLNLDTMSAKGLGVNGLKVDGTDDSNALSAIETIKEAIQKVSSQRSDLGAVQNRLEHTINNLDNVVENTTSAESQIRDTDMATEMVQYSNQNILSQAGQAMLAQANQSNQGVLSLLG